MNVVKRISRNASMLLISQCVNLVLGFIYVVYIARYLGAEQYGILAFAFALAGIFAIVADLGVGTLLVREIARHKTAANAYFSNVLVLKLLLALLMFGLILLTTRVANLPPQIGSVISLVALYVIFTSFSQTFYSLFQAYERMEFQSLSTVAYSIIMLCGVATAISRGASVFSFALLYALVSLLIVGVNVGIAVRFFALRIEGLKAPCVKRLVIAALPFGAFNLFMLFNYKVDSILLALWIGETSVGWYNAAYGLILALYVIPTALVGALFPFLSSAGAESHATLKTAYAHATKLLLIVALPLVVGTIVLADSIIAFLYGPGYANASDALRILMISLVPTFIYYVLGTMILVLNKERQALVFWGACATVNVALNAVLIPRYSYIGASVVTVISEFVLFALFFFVVSAEVGRIALWSTAQKPLAASIVVGLVLYVLRDVYLPLAVVAGVAIYAILLVTMRTLTSEEVALVKQLVGRGTDIEG
jgi:O-antigen/teichoic acid export membrane protein